MKQKKNGNSGIALIWLIWIVIIIVVIIWLIRIFLGPVSPIRRMVIDFNKYGYSELFDQFDVNGLVLFMSLGVDNLDDYYDKYKELNDYLQDDEDLRKEFDEVQNFVDEYADKIGIFSDDDAVQKIKIKKVVSKEKISKNLYKVKVKIVTETKQKNKSSDNKDDDDKKTSIPETLKFYTLKNGLKYKIVGMEGWSVTDGMEIFTKNKEEILDILDIKAP